MAKEKTRTLLVVLELPVRAMTDEEWEYAWEECGHDEQKIDGPGPQDTLQEVGASDLSDAIAGALNSANNQEMLAGTGLFIHTDDARVLSSAWKEGE
ncbi:hypothetical protein SAMN05216456_1938 [Devosia crocina]|uniref:Uncharacterized protein n=1 Tax=Devosia crocina TaxID=429728 RepID=A0A1I7NF21_9HYPH|nr:hypothetical protein [Devosia crocina]SFV33264.1 hypothetical protein SAMN05216456_1938 [Devosia crocina]